MSASRSNSSRRSSSSSKKKKTTKKTVKKTVKKSVKKSVNKTVKKAVKKPVKKTVKKAVKKPVKKTVNKTVKKAVKKATAKKSNEMKKLGSVTKKSSGTKKSNASTTKKTTSKKSNASSTKKTTVKKSNASVAKKTTAKSTSKSTSKRTTTKKSNASTTKKTTTKKSNASTTKKTTTKKSNASTTKKTTVKKSNATTKKKTTTKKSNASTTKKTTAKKSNASTTKKTTKKNSNEMKKLGSVTKKSSGTKKSNASNKKATGNNISKGLTPIARKSKSNNSTSFKYSPTAGRNIRTTQDKTSQALIDLKKAANILYGMSNKGATGLISTIDRLQKNINRANSNLSAKARKVSLAGSNVQTQIRNISKNIGSNIPKFRFNTNNSSYAGNNKSNRKKLTSIGGSNNSGSNITSSKKSQKYNKNKSTIAASANDPWNFLNYNLTKYAETRRQYIEKAGKIVFGFGAGFVGGFAGGLEKPVDGLVTLVGLGADYLGFDSFGAGCANFVKTDYAKNWQDNVVKTCGLDPKAAAVGNILGETTFDIVATTAASHIPGGKAIYSGLKETGETAQELYRDSSVNIKDSATRKKVALASAGSGLAAGVSDAVVNIKFLKKAPKNCGQAFVLTGTVSAVAGFGKTYAKTKAKSYATGKKYKIDKGSVARDAALTFIISGTGSAAEKHGEKLKQNFVENENKVLSEKSNYDFGKKRIDRYTSSVQEDLKNEYKEQLSKTADAADIFDEKNKLYEKAKNSNFIGKSITNHRLAEKMIAEKAWKKNQERLEKVSEKVLNELTKKDKIITKATEKLQILYDNSSKSI